MKNKKYWLITATVTLLPMVLGLLLWNRLPDKLPTHFGIDGAADGWSGKGFVVFGMPLLMLLFHGVIYFATRLDKQNRGHNEKVMNLVGLLFPVMSTVIFFVICGQATDLELSLSSLLFLPLGLMFILVGNWMPKIKQNSTLGIKIKWTLYSEENWNKTHRFAGFVWVIGGVVFCLMGFVPGQMLVFLLPIQIILLAFLPMVYSWRLAKKQQLEGTYTESEVNKNLRKHPVILAVSMVLVAALLIFVGILLFTGDIAYTCTADALVIDADFHADSAVPYDRIDSLEYRAEAPQGTRTWGFASARLMLGWFDSEEFGSHTRYSYTRTDAHIVVTCGDDFLILNAENEEATRALYDALTAKLAG